MSINLALASIKATATPVSRTFADRFADAVFTRDHGVKGDGKRVSDIGCTNGSAVVTSSSFTAADKTTPAKVINAYIGTSVVASGQTVTGNRRITGFADVTGIAPLQSVTGTNIPAGAYVTAVDVANKRVFLNRDVAATGTGTVSLTFTNPVSTTIIDAAAGTATLAVNASSTLASTRGTFGSDDTAPLRLAVAAGFAKGLATLILSAGISMITGTINDPVMNAGSWPSHVSVTGWGRGTSELCWASAQSMADTPGNRAVIWAAHGAHSASLTDCVFEDFYINLDAAIDTPYNYNGTAMRLVMNRNCTIRNMKFSGSPATCLGVDNPQNLLVEGCIFENCARLGVGGGGSFAVLMNEVANNPENFTFTNNQIFNSGVFGVMWENFYSAAGQQVTINDDTAIVSNNYIYYDAYQPNATYVYAIQDRGGYGSKVFGNIIKGPPINSTQFVGIGCAKGDTTTFLGGGAQAMHIFGNTVEGMGTPVYIFASGSNDIVIESNIVTGGGQPSTGGIAINNNADGTSRAISGLVIRNNKVFGNAGAGIMTTASNTTPNLNWVIQDNLCHNNGQSGGNRAGILFATPQTGLTLTGNVCYDDATGLQQYGLQVAAGVAITGAFVADNNFAGNAVSALNILGTIAGIFQGNKGMPAPTISGNAITPTGNGDIGTYTSNVTGLCTVVVTPFGTANVIADNGYLGTAFDKTTPANAQAQTAYSTTSLTFAGQTVAGDVIAFNARMW